MLHGVLSVTESISKAMFCLSWVKLNIVGSPLKAIAIAHGAIIKIVPIEIKK